MARIKRHRNVEKHQKIKHRHRKPNIPELVYKYLAANEESFNDTERHLVSKCRCCGQEKHHDEVMDSTSETIDRATGHRIRQGQRKDNGRISKLRNIKRRPISKDLSTSYLQKYTNGEDTKKARKYMKKALDFGVESGYLIPSDPTYKILRVSSDLMKSDSRRSKSICDMALYKNGNIPTKLEDFHVQEQRKRRRRRGRRRQGRRSRSGSRMRRRSRRRRSRRSRSYSRGRQRNSPQNPEEVAEDKADDYEMDENDPKSNIHTDDVERERKTLRSNQPERSVKKSEEDGSDLSIDEDETDDENERKGTDITKS